VQQRGQERLLFLLLLLLLLFVVLILVLVLNKFLQLSIEVMATNTIDIIMWISVTTFLLVQWHLVHRHHRCLFFRILSNKNNLNIKSNKNSLSNNNNIKIRHCKCCRLLLLQKISTVMILASTFRVLMLLLLLPLVIPRCLRPTN